MVQKIIKIISAISIISIGLAKMSSSYTLIDSLPKNMPLSKKIIWGNDGLARKLNLAPKDRIGE